MSTDVRWCFEDQPLDEVMIQMADRQIRRIPVVSHDDQHKLVGIIALGDVATKTQDSGQKGDVEEVVEMVSTPSEPKIEQGSAQEGTASIAGGAEKVVEDGMMGASQSPKAGDVQTSAQAGQQANGGGMQAMQGG